MVNHYQELLFKQIRNLLPERVLPAQEIADILNISTDAAYRRIRGEKSISFDEVCALCGHFNLSVDQLLQLKQNHVNFEYIPVKEDKTENILSHVAKLSEILENYKSEKNKKLFYLAADIPFVHLAAYDELSVFRIFTWANSVFNLNGNYSAFREVMNQPVFHSYREAIALNYTKIPSVEIWNSSSFDSMIGLIDFFYVTGTFGNKETVLTLCNQILQLADDLQEQTEKGFKYHQEGNRNIQFYISDIALENNFMLIKSDSQRDCFIRLFTANGMIIYDQQFCAGTEKWYMNILNKSTLISGCSQKERYRFFQLLKDKVQELLAKIHD